MIQQGSLSAQIVVTIAKLFDSLRSGEVCQFISPHSPYSLINYLNSAVIAGVMVSSPSDFNKGANFPTNCLNSVIASGSPKKLVLNDPTITVIVVEHKDRTKDIKKKPQTLLAMG